VPLKTWQVKADSIRKFNRAVGTAFEEVLTFWVGDPSWASMGLWVCSLFGISVYSLRKKEKLLSFRGMPFAEESLCGIHL
jgi:hypothetical protein